MSFAIIISEKGGAERRELFDKNEVVVGRLQGNDLMLQKSNVSKKHAKLIFHGGRFIVADIESTNGTYVNGRRIGKPTIVREGDKIYVGDFVLRCEAGPGAVLAPESSPSAPGPREATAAELAQVSSIPSPAPREGISHYPLEHDPDESQSARISIPAAPRLPTGLARPGGTQAMTAQPPPPLPQGPVTDQGNAAIHALAHAVAGTSPAGPPRPPPTRIPAPALPSTPTPAREAPTNSAQRLSLLALLDALTERVDLEPLRAGTWPVDGVLAQRIDQHLRELIPQLRQAGEISESVDPNLLLRDAQRELIGLGPIGALLEDPEITTIQIHHHESILVQRGPGMPTSEPGFSGETALLRVIARLCSQSGRPLAPDEFLVDRPLASGNLLAILPPLSSTGATLHLRRPRPEPPIEDPVRTGVISRVAWNFIQQSLGARLGVLVIGPPSVLGFFSALLPLLPPEERTALLLPPELSLPLPPQGVAFRLEPPRSEDLIRQVARMGFDRVIATCEGSSPALTEALARRAVSPLVFASGASARQALARLSAQNCAARPGLLPEVAREWIASCFDLLIEVTRLRDGRLRVVRVAEVNGVDAGQIALRDLFLAVPDRNNNGESHLSPTGTTPHFLDDLRNKGYAVDPSLFERISSR